MRKIEGLWMKGVNMAHPKTPKWRKCRDCDYKPEKKVFSTACPRCCGVMRVIK